MSPVDNMAVVEHTSSVSHSNPTSRLGNGTLSARLDFEGVCEGERERGRGAPEVNLTLTRDGG